MAQSCDFKISANIEYNCANPVLSGVMNTGYIINFDDINRDTLAKTGNVVTSLSAKDSAYRIYIAGKTPFSGTKKEMAVGTYRTDFTKTVEIVVLDNGAGVNKNVIQKLANGKFVVILENKFTGTDNDNTFEIYGLEQGLIASAGTDDKYSEDTEGGWAVTLVEENAPTSGIFFLMTATETKSAVQVTREALEALVGDDE